MRRGNLSLDALVSAAFAVGATTQASANTWLLTYEQPTVQATTATFISSGVEAFDAVALGSGQTFSTSFGGSPIAGTYSGVQITAADQYGGAGGSGRYAVVFNSSYTLSLGTSVNYFGYWLSALDFSNVVTFYDGQNLVGQFSAGAVFGAAVTGNPAYFGNPNSSFLGNDAGEPFAFVNFYSIGAGDKFDRLVFSEGPNGGYETDNHTVGIYKDIGGIPLVPEPATAFLMLLGFGIFGSIRVLKGQKSVTISVRA